MTSHLALGIFAVLVSLTTFVLRFVVPQPTTASGSQRATLLHDGWFPVVAFGVVPAIAGAMFLAAWVQTSDALGEPDVLQGRAPSASIAR